MSLVVVALLLCLPRVPFWGIGDVFSGVIAAQRALTGTRYDNRRQHQGKAVIGYLGEAKPVVEQRDSSGVRAVAAFFSCMANETYFNTVSSWGVFAITRRLHGDAPGKTGVRLALRINGMRAYPLAALCNARLFEQPLCRTPESSNTDHVHKLRRCS